LHYFLGCQAQLERARELAHSLSTSIPTDLSKEQGLPKYALDNIRNYASLLLQTTSWMADWARQAPVVGRFVPVALVSKTVAEPASTDPAAEDPSHAHHDPAAAREPAGNDEDHHGEETHWNADQLKLLLIIEPLNNKK
jgi:hypothetical protein